MLLKAAVIAAPSSRSSLKRSLKSRAMAAIHSLPSPPSMDMPGKMVFEQLVYHESGPAHREITKASGLAARARARSWLRAEIDLRGVALHQLAPSTDFPSMASVETGTSSGWPNT